MGVAQNSLLELHEEIRWFGQKILSAERLHLGNVSDVLPKFRREAFGPNEYLDMIVRQPDKIETRPIPVAAVSKRYALIQHGELVQWVSEG